MTVLGVQPRMARKKTTKKRKDSPRRIIGIRCREEWAQWLDEAAVYCRTDVSKLIDAALVDYLKAKGFPAPPPER